MKTLLAVALALAPLTAFAQSFPDMGARSLGMAGAYVAFVNGPTATYWNPAGVPLNQPTAVFVYGRTVSDPENLSENLSDLAATGATESDILNRPLDALRALDVLGDISGSPDPMTGQEPSGLFYAGGNYGFSIYRLKLVEATPFVDTQRIQLVDDPETGIQYNDSRLGVRQLRLRDWVLSLAGSLGDPRFLIGGNLRLSQGQTKVDLPSLHGFPDFNTSDLFSLADDVEKTENTKFSFDVGTLLQLHPKFRLGVVGKWLGSPEFEVADGSKMKLDPRWRAGMAIFASDAVSLSADFDLNSTRFSETSPKRQGFAFGGQVLVAGKSMALRGGYRNNFTGPDERLLTAGIGLASSSAIIDFAIGFAPNTDSVSWAIEVGAGSGKK